MTDTAQSGDGWVIDPNVKMKDYREFVKVSEQTTAGADTSLLYPLLAKFIKAWPHALDPAVPDSYDELTITQFREVIERVTGAFQVFTASSK